MPPAPPLGWSARFHSLVLALGGAAGRWMGCFGSHLRTLIWILFLRKQGLGRKHFVAVVRASCRISNTFSPTDSPGRAHPAGPGGSPQTGPEGPNPPFRPTDSPGRARLTRVPPAAAGGKGCNHVLTGSAGQTYFSPRVPASPARFGVHPPILGGAFYQAEPLTPPYAALPNEAQPSGAPPKILTPAGHPYGKAPPASPPKTPPQ